MWQDRLSRARFRDTEFLTDSHEAKGGRRLVVHEYPGSDIPNAEDLGLKAWDWSLSAYFIGPDYDLKRNAFLALLAEPGAAWLTHPWLGLLWVRVRDWSVSETNDKGGYCAVKITFVPGGEIPQPDTDKGDWAQGCCGGLADESESLFDLLPMSAGAMQSYIAAVQSRLEGLRKIISLATLPLTWANQVLNVIYGVKADLQEIAGLPDAYARAWRSISNALGLHDPDGGNPSGLASADGNRPVLDGAASSAGRLPSPPTPRTGGNSPATTTSSLYPQATADTISPLDRAAIVSRIAAAASDKRKAVAIEGAAAGDAALQANLDAEYALEQRMIAAAALSVAVADYPSEDARDTALAAVDAAVARLLPAAPDTVFQAATSARAAVLDVLQSQDLRPSASRAVAHPLPAVLIAHQLEVDEESFIARNRVRHPLFVSGVVHG